LYKKTHIKELEKFESNSDLFLSPPQYWFTSDGLVKWDWVCDI
jgi:hypothetical protein